MPNHIHLLIEIQNKYEIQKMNEFENTNGCKTTTHIVEAHSSASPSSISTTKSGAELNNGHIMTTNVAETHCCAPLRDDGDEKQSESNFGRKPKSISSFVAIFKSITTKQINGTESIWQTNYHDHIVRNYKRFEIIYDYIKNNPQSWETDSLK
ncbi:hypothetical protein [Flavobacterium sp. 2]|uniref:hypothetical protein n=1 Tax=Flavobacterium sp. 2 TaxID=308053 RepID=UPI003CE6CE16